MIILGRSDRRTGLILLAGAVRLSDRVVWPYDYIYSTSRRPIDAVPVPTANTSRPHLSQTFRISPIAVTSHQSNNHKPQFRMYLPDAELKKVLTFQRAASVCFVTKTLKYTHQLTHWINAGDPEPIASIKFHIRGSY